LHAALLPEASSVTFVPGATLAGTCTAATGRSAACRAPDALAIPAPQVWPSSVQMHSEV